MAILLEDIMEEVMLNLESFIADQDVYGTLAANITNTATTFTLAGPAYPDGSGFDSGIIEIGTELVYVENFDRTTGIATGVLRGFRGTTAEAHTAGTGVRNSPRFPRIAVKRAINDAIAALHPRIMSVKKTEIVINASIKQYELPANTVEVLSVQHETHGPSKLWLPSKRWWFDFTGASNTTTGKAVSIIDGSAGNKAQVVYVADPTELTYGDDFSTVTGLPAWARDIVVYGACWRLVSFLDTGRTSINTAEQSLLNSPSYSSTATVGTTNAKFFLAIYNQRLAEGEARQRREYPALIHWNF